MYMMSSSSCCFSSKTCLVMSFVQTISSTNIQKVKVSKTSVFMNSLDQSHLFLGLNVISTLFHFSLKVVELLLFDNVVTTCISCFLLTAMNIQLLSL